jgi:SsrA-binding protein
MKVSNKKAFFDYQITETFEAGINLYGSEVKAVRLGRADLTGSFVRIIGNEAYLVNANILPYQSGQIENYDAQRSRKLLLHKKELISLRSKADGAGLALVPVSLYFKHGFIKLEIGLGKGKKQYDKREAIKKRDIKRSLEQDL